MKLIDWFCLDSKICRWYTVFQLSDGWNHHLAWCRFSMERFPRPSLYHSTRQTKEHSYWFFKHFFAKLNPFSSIDLVRVRLLTSNLSKFFVNCLNVQCNPLFIVDFNISHRQGDFRRSNLNLHWISRSVFLLLRAHPNKWSIWFLLVEHIDEESDAISLRQWPKYEDYWCVSVLWSRFTMINTTLSYL